MSQIAIGFTLVATAFAGAIFVLPYFVNVGRTAADLMPIILVITLAAAAGIRAILARSVLLPLKELIEGSKLVARGNMKQEVHRGVISKSRLRNADDLSRVVLAFEMMRRKVLELEKSVNNTIKEKHAHVQQIGDELVEKEMVLQRANAKLVGQREELQRFNDELSLKNEELSEANAKLQKLDKMKTDFILIAAHELRTPIQPIIGSVQLAQKGMLSTDEAWKAIVSESKRLSNIADYILDVGKIESGTFTYDMRPVNVKKLIETVTSSSSKLASEDGLITISAQHENQDVIIIGDKERLIQAFSNIINNAVKFAKNGTITIATKSSRDKDVVEIRITDDGPGIPREILPVLFTKFVTKTQENERGTGLGLFITKTIIEAHNGTIRAENNDAHGGKGASFTISLPVKAPKEQAALAEKQTI